ncbi:hypothetical protein, partial [Rhizobium sp. WYCCWR 11146]|uniref:hypothetical protein n=1 Tax=Rhizobium sp. WYCCWR 11146 TaxID=2749833 RepID=UPI001AED126B
RKTSSPAAPPPSFSEWAYRTNPLEQSTALFEKTDFSFKALFFQGKFQVRSFPGFRPAFTRPGKMNVFRLFVKRTLFCPLRPDIITICWS